MMLKKMLIPLLLLTILTQANAQFKGVLKKVDEAKVRVEEKINGGTGLSQEEVGTALKQALDAGVVEAVDFLSAEDGYYKSAYKILVPEDAQKVTSKLKAIPGWSNIEKTLEEKMNRAAEIAVEKAKPIFVNAIKKMTFQDAMNILMGERNAATAYLHKTTYQSLFDEFMPVIQSSLDEVNAREYWRGAVNAYNKIPFVSRANPELDQHVTQMALVGLFDLVENKEASIRTDVNERKTDLLKKVFSKQD
jgi:coenzyme F420-reducing hydrogenase beta subunit